MSSNHALWVLFFARKCYVCFRGTISIDGISWKNPIPFKWLTSCASETPNTHQKSKKNLWKLVGMEKISWRLFPGYIFFPSGNISSFCVSFNISSIVFWIHQHQQSPSRYSCDFWETTISRCCVRSRSVCPTRGLKGHMGPMWTMAEILWPVETDIVSVSCYFFSSRILYMPSGAGFEL